MKSALLFTLCWLLIISFKAQSQETIPAVSDEAEIFFQKAMAEIKTDHIAWIKRTAMSVNSQQLDETAVRKMATTYANLGNLNGADIEALCFLVLMQAAKSAQEDLKSIMAHVKAINSQKSKLRDVLSMLNDKNQRITRIRLDSVRLLSVQTQVLQRQNNPEKNQFIRTTTRDSLKSVRTTVPVSRAEIDEAKIKAGNDLDSMSEMGEMESLRLQMAMDRMSKMMSTLSNLLKKISGTQDSIIANLK
jgi:hypothetical protein